jgi:trigger factor
MKPEEVKEVTVSFPADYPRQDLAAAQVVFSFTLKELKTKELPVLDDDFAQDISEYQTIEEFTKFLESEFQKKAEDETTENIQQAILEELTKITEIELPETYVEQEIKNILTQTAMQMEQYGLDVSSLFSQDNLPKLKDNARPDAIKKIKEKLILEEISRTEGLKVDPEVLQERIEEVKKELEGRPYDNQRLAAFLEEELLNKKTLEWLQEKAKVELVPPAQEEAEEPASK